ETHDSSHPVPVDEAACGSGPWLGSDRSLFTHAGRARNVEVDQSARTNSRAGWGRRSLTRPGFGREDGVDMRRGCARPPPETMTMFPRFLPGRPGRSFSGLAPPPILTA